VIHRTRLPTGEWLAGCRWQEPLSGADVRQTLLAFG
jgi:hypothetical protein